MKLRDTLKGGAPVARRDERHRYIRFASYFAGFLLFYSPAALALRAFSALEAQQRVGNVCDTLNLRMGVGGLLSLDRWLSMTWDPRQIGILAVMAIAFVAGPLFCGWLCAAGAFSEFLSRLVPDRWKFDPAGKVNAGAVRYGFLAGYVSLPFLGLSAGCSYCNFRVLEYVALGFEGSFLPALSSTYIIVTVLWLVVGGLLMKGGRGWCIFLCPVGAVQNLVYAVGARFQRTAKIVYRADKCRSCNNCVSVCPTRAILPAEKGQWLAESGTGVLIDIHTCLACSQCVAVCPHKALRYGQGTLAQARRLPDAQVQTS